VRAQAVAAAYAIPSVEADWRALLGRTDITAVVVATPDDTHCEIACAALEAGKAVLLQKPMARTTEEARRILAAARWSGVPLEVSFMHRHFPEVVRAREILRTGRCGRVLSARLRNATPGPDWSEWFYAREKVGGGVVLQLGVHGIDLVLHLLGPIKDVLATTALGRPQRTLRDGRIVQPDNEDLAHALYGLGGGATVSHEMSMSEVAGTDRFTLEIYCTEATLHLRGPRGPLAIWWAGEANWEIPELSREPAGLRHHAEFLEIAAGRHPATGTAEDGLAGLIVAEAVYRSAEQGRLEPVDAQGGDRP
jgi:predicted dehydrogenase